MKPVYMDYAATTPVDSQVLQAMLPYFQDVYGNPSSLHRFGQAPKYAVEEAREILASAIGAAPGEIVFTCGGTESNNFALKGIAWAAKERGGPHHYSGHRTSCRLRALFFSGEVGIPRDAPSRGPGWTG